MTNNPDQPMTKRAQEHELSSIASEVLEQSKSLLKSLPDENSFVKESIYVPKSNIAKHIRHIVDHYKLLLDHKLGASQNEPDIWTVEYDSRERNILMETDRRVAIQEIEKVQAVIMSTHTPLDSPVRLLAVINSANKEESEVQSNYGRELWFCVHHAIHHHALIKVICIEHGISLPDSFGVAPSTQKYLQKSGLLTSK